MRNKIVILLLLTFSNIGLSAQKCDWAKSIGSDGDDDIYCSAVDAFGSVYFAGSFTSKELVFGGTKLNNLGNSDAYLAKYSSEGIAIWAKSIKGVNDEYIYDISIDNNGFIYICGLLLSDETFFDSKKVQNFGNQDAFVAKYDSNGNLVWVNIIGGIENDCAYKLTNDKSGNVFVAGEFFSNYLYFNNTSNIICFNNNNSYKNYFFIKINANGEELWTKLISGDKDENVKDLVIDNFENIIIAGSFNSAIIYFDGGQALTNRSSLGGTDAFIAKFSQEGKCEWSEQIHGKDNEEISSLAISNDNIFVSGNFTSNTVYFNNEHEITKISDQDCFLAIFTINGSCKSYPYKFGGDGIDEIIDMKSDKHENIYIIGKFKSNTIDFGKHQLLGNFDGEIFLTKLSTIDDFDVFDRIECKWAEKISGNGIEEPKSISINNNKEIYIAGYYNSPKLFFNSGQSSNNLGLNDGFIVKYIPSIYPPTLIQPYDGSLDVDTNVTIKWDFEGNIANFIIQVSEDLTFFNPKEYPYNSNVFEYTLSNLLPDKKYYWRLNAFWGIDTSDWSETWSFTTRMEKPETPTLISPANNSTNVDVNPTLIWNSVEVATSYRVQVSTSNTFTSNHTDEVVTDTSKALSGLANNTQYYWRVRAMNASDFSDWSETWSFTTRMEKPETPTLISPANNSINTNVSPTLTWNSAFGATSYRVQVSISNTFTSNHTDEVVTDTSKALSGLANNTQYYWRVRAMNASDFSDWSETWSFTTRMEKPETPTLISPANNSINTNVSPTLTWNSAFGATSYRVQVSISNTFTSNHTDELVTDTSKALSGLANNTQYYWRVRAMNASDFSDWSETWSFTTLSGSELGPPELLSPADNSLDQPQNVTLVWEHPDTSASFTIQVSNNKEFESFLIYKTVQNKYLDLENLDDSTDYYWRVKAFKGVDTSGWSDEYTFRTANIFDPTPTLPILVYPNNGSADISVTPTMQWEAYPGANKYTLLVSSSSDFRDTVLIVNDIKTIEYPISNKFLNETTYYWKVAANAGSATVWSVVWHFTTVAEFNLSGKPILDKPDDEAEGLSPNNIVLSWKPFNGANEYEVLISNSKDLVNIVDNKRPTETSYVIPNLKFSEKYFWKVRAHNQDKSSEWSEVRSFSTSYDTIKVSLKVECLEKYSPQLMLKNQPISIPLKITSLSSNYDSAFKPDSVVAYFRVKRSMFLPLKNDEISCIFANSYDEDNIITAKVPVNDLKANDALLYLKGWVLLGNAPNTTLYLDSVLWIWKDNKKYNFKNQLYEGEIVLDIPNHNHRLIDFNEDFEIINIYPQPNSTSEITLTYQNRVKKDIVALISLYNNSGEKLEDIYNTPQNQDRVIR